MRPAVHQMLAAQRVSANYRESDCSWRSDWCAMRPKMRRRKSSRNSSALETNRKMIGNVSGFIRTDVEVHFMFAKIMRNPAFVALHEAMSSWLLQQRQIALSEPGEDKRGYKAHARIFAAVKARNPDEAEAAMRDHLGGWVAFWRRYGDREAVARSTQ